MKEQNITVKLCRSGVYHVLETAFSAFPFGLFYPEKMGAVSGGHSKRFHQDISFFLLQSFYINPFSLTLVGDRAKVIKINEINRVLNIFVHVS